MKQPTASSYPKTTQEMVDLLEKAGHGESLYAKALKNALEEEKVTPGQGRGIVMSTMVRKVSKRQS
jgi:hypothetical protein